MTDSLAHDQSYKLLFGQPAMMAALLHSISGNDWLASLDLQTLQPLPTEHISSKLDKRHNDLVSRQRSSVGLRWPSNRIAALHRLPIRSHGKAKQQRHG